MEFIRAKWQYTGRRGKKPRLVVIHCTVSPESPTGAEAVARYFQRGERKASAHRVADNNSVIMCVPDENTAFGAAGANSDGLHMELVGHATQTADQWRDPYSRAELQMAAPSIREWSKEYGISLRWLSVAQVRDGVSRGLCTHHDVSLAFPDVSTGHWDPGPNFPKILASQLWSLPKPPPMEDDDMPSIIKKADDEKWWLADGFQRRWIKDRDEAKGLALSGIAKLGPAGEAFVVADSVVDRQKIVT